MTLDWREHPEARAEFLEAHGRYLEIDDGALADQFINEAEAAAALILQWPDAPPPYGGRRGNPLVRSWHLGKFPFRLIYTVIDEDVVVLAYAHSSRRPGYWARRLG